MSYPYPSTDAMCRAFALVRAGQLPKRVEPKPEFETLSPLEAAQQLNVGVRAIRKAIHERRLAAFRVGSRNWRIRVVDLNKYIETLLAEWGIRPSDDAKP
jgi:excisionase family DNA binding protein